MEDQKILLQKIVEGIQEKKGKKIITADLSAIDSIFYHLRRWINNAGFCYCRQHS